MPNVGQSLKMTLSFRTVPFSFYYACIAVSFSPCVHNSVLYSLAVIVKYDSPLGDAKLVYLKMVSTDYVVSWSGPKMPGLIFCTGPPLAINSDGCRVGRVYVLDGRGVSTGFLWACLM